MPFFLRYAPEMSIPIIDLEKSMDETKVGFVESESQKRQFFRNNWHPLLRYINYFFPKLNFFKHKKQHHSSCNHHHHHHHQHKYPHENENLNV